MRISPLRLGALGALLLCAVPGRGAEERAALEARLELQQEDGRAARAFASGEAIVLVVVLRNPSQAPRSLSLATAKTHDFSVSTRDGREIWRWSAGRSFAQMLGEIVLAPGEEKEFRETWRPGALPPGPYRADAWIGAGASGARAAAVDFRID